MFLNIRYSKLFTNIHKTRGPSTTRYKLPTCVI